MNNMESKHAFYGSRGMLWIDGERIAEVLEVKATLTAKKIEVPRARHMTVGYKQVGYEGKGSFKIHKVSSYFIEKLAPSIKEGRQVLFTLVSDVDDPDAIGNERVELYNCMVDSVDLINWAVNKLSEEEYNFTFEGFEITDKALA